MGEEERSRATGQSASAGWPPAAGVGTGTGWSSARQQKNITFCVLGGGGGGALSILGGPLPLGALGVRAPPPLPLGALGVLPPPPSCGPLRRAAGGGGSAAPPSPLAGAPAPLPPPPNSREERPSEGIRFCTGFGMVDTKATL